MKESLKNVFWGLNGAAYIPAIFAIYYLSLRQFGMLGVVPAAYFGSAGMIAIQLCRKSKWFMVGLALFIVVALAIRFLSHAR